MVEVRNAESRVDLDEFRRLVAGFITWLKDLYPNNVAGVDEYFASLRSELDSLPGEYGPPGGRILLAMRNGKACGAVAMRDLGDGTCEMKRMFVERALHGDGVGRALAEALISEARSAGYERMRLETSVHQVAALGLYTSIGFRSIEPYYDVSENLRPGLRFMELPL
jgi:putative acetyltransferase